MASDGQVCGADHEKHQAVESFRMDQSSHDGMAGFDMGSLGSSAGQPDCAVCPGTCLCTVGRGKTA